jgi:anti-sigma factor (TIGR02949 family)
VTKKRPADPGHISCEEVVAHLLEYLDGELAGGRRGRMARHLEECRGCCTRLELETALRRKVAELGEEKATPSLRDRLKAMIDSF